MRIHPLPNLRELWTNLRLPAVESLEYPSVKSSDDKTEKSNAPCSQYSDVVNFARGHAQRNGSATVRDAEAETGHPLLRKAAEDNARTWKFVAHTPGTFHVTFRYKLLSGNVDVEFLETPAIVEIEASPPETIIYYAWIGLGTWKAHLRSAHGKSLRVLKLSYSGPNGDWLAGNALGPKDESEEIDFGHKEGNFVAFTITLSQPDGQHVKIFLIGKISGDKIVGTSVDDAGIRGDWTAVRIADSPNSQ